MNKLPTLGELMVFKYMDKGERKKLRIIRTASHKWKDIASLVCDDFNVHHVLEQKCHGDPNECLKQVFIRYFIDRKPVDYSQDWNGLIELLDDVGLESLAKEVEHTLKSGSEVMVNMGHTYQDAQERLVGHTLDHARGSTSVPRLSDSDHSTIYEKLAPHAAKWRDIGRELGFEQEEIDNIQSIPMLIMQAPESFLREMLSQWLQWAPGDGRGSTDFATRESLRAALLRANLGQLGQGQHSTDQQPSERDRSHDGSRGPALQHSSQAEGRDECTVNDNMMIPIPKENYVCVAQSSNCLVYLSKDVNQKLSIETVTNTNIHSKIASNELELTPIVRITPDNMMESLDKLAIIELLKNIKLSEKEAKNETIPLCAYSETSEWRELGPECNCQVHEDRISFEVTYFSLYTVISRRPFPSSTMIVKPSADIPAPSEITIAELPGFKVQIPPCSVNAEVEITATMLYDCPAVCSEEDRRCLASSCIRLEPHGMPFSKNVSISIPLPDYAEIMENNPNAQLQVWHSDVTGNKQWNLVDYYLRKDEDGLYIAVVETNHFSTFKAKFKDILSRLKSLFNNSFNIEVRCQVFMSQETVFKSQLKFGIAVLFGPYKNKPDSIPQNYKHVLADSDRVDLQVSRHDKIHFAVELDEALLPLRYKPIAGLFAINGRQQKSFTIKLDGKVVLSGGLPMGELSIGVQGAQGFEENCQTMNLIKPPEPSSSSSNLKTTYQFEESVDELEVPVNEENDHQDKVALTLGISNREEMVPSGHILTKEELQVLGAMLAMHSDTKLKSIQLSLEEEQEIRDISREEVEKCLRQNSLTSMADGLKDNIEKGIAWLPTAYTSTGL